MTQLQDSVRLVAGLLAAAVLVYMSYLSLQDDFTLKVPVIIAMLSVIVLLMYGTKGLVNIIDAYRRNE